MVQISKRAYSWIPNLFTLGNLSLGFFAVIFSFSKIPNAHAIAGILILLAVLADGLDGWAARLLGSQSELGAQLDSLADLTTFGVAPGALMYEMLLGEYNFWYGPLFVPLGMFIAVIYPACAAFRLARFNVTHDPSSFVGLPSPMAGLMVALLPLIEFYSLSIPEWIFAVLFVVIGFLMVSTIRYSKPQVTMLRRFSPARLAVILLFLIGGLIFIWLRYGPSYSAAALFLLLVLYVVSGLVSFLIHAIQELRV